MSLLQQTQSTTQQVAEAISSVLDIEVTVVDDSLVRIAGTGEHKFTIGQKLTGKPMYLDVIKNRKTFIVTDVDTDCIDCDKQASCKQLAELCCPIVMGTEVIGVIGLIAFSSERRVELVNKNERLLTFIRQMAELIAVKAAEADTMNRLFVMKNQLATVLNFITEGVLAIDKAAKISNINYAAEKMLKVKAGDVVGFHLNEVLPGTPIPEVLLNGIGFSDREISIWQKGRHHHYVINATPMIIDGTVNGVVATFSPVSNRIELPVVGIQSSTTFDNFIGSSSGILAVKAEGRKAAEISSTILIVGESGTGKDVLAQAIHNESPRSSKPFVTVNCAAIPEHLLESELFGYAEGSFTGAKKGGKPGKFQLAHGGTLFLDEIGDMPLALQAKMLRVLQEKVVEPVGAVKSYPVDVRIIAATNRNLEDLIAKGLFRKDLYYRLNVFLISIPPLRERSQDITELAYHFLQKHSFANGKEIKTYSDESIRALQTYSWPGNVRELENTVECAVIRAAGSCIEKTDLPVKIQTTLQDSLISLSIEDPEKQKIITALETYGNSVQGKRLAAHHLGIGIATLYRKMKIHNLQTFIPPNRK